MEQIDPIFQLDKSILLAGMRMVLPPKPAGHAERIQTIKDLSRRVMEKVPEITATVGDDRYSIIANDVKEINAPATIAVMVVVSSFSNLPGWCETLTIEPGTSARFVHKGLPRDLGQTVAQIYQTWVPRMPQLFAKNLEIIRYPPNYDPTNPQGSFEYLLPLT